MGDQKVPYCQVWQYHAQKKPKMSTSCRVSEAKFYLYHSTKIAKARPWFDEIP